jgi:hypothetical protein
MCAGSFGWVARPAGLARGVLRLGVDVGVERGVAAGGEVALPAAEIPGSL